MVGITVIGISIAGITVIGITVIGITVAGITVIGITVAGITVIGISVGDVGVGGHVTASVTGVPVVRCRRRWRRIVDREGAPQLVERSRVGIVIVAGQVAHDAGSSNDIGSVSSKPTRRTSLRSR
jgi:hypothetical protein